VVLALDQVTRGGVLEDEQIVKIGLGADGDHDCLLDSGQQAMALSVPVAIASDQTALPVSGPLTNAELRAVAVPISAASLPLPTGAATDAKLAALIGGIRYPVVFVDAGGNPVEVEAADESKNYVAGTGLTVKRAILNYAAAGDNEVVAAVAAKAIRVLSLFSVAGAAVTGRFESGAGGDALTGQMDFGANGGVVLPHNPAGWFETNAGDALSLELGGAVRVAGALTYVEVP
jgi:hypothetical protein